MILKSNRIHCSLTEKNAYPLGRVFRLSPWQQNYRIRLSSLMVRQYDNMSSCGLIKSFTVDKKINFNYLLWIHLGGNSKAKAYRPLLPKRRKKKSRMSSKNTDQASATIDRIKKEVIRLNIFINRNKEQRILWMYYYFHKLNIYVKFWIGFARHELAIGSQKAPAIWNTNKKTKEKIQQLITSQ